MRNFPHRAALLPLALATFASAQSPVPVREVGKLEQVSSIRLESVAGVLVMPVGTVLVNDVRARRLLLLDSTLARRTVVADTTGATAGEYARGSGEVLLRFRGDSGLLVNVSTFVALVISPQGTIGRVLAFPPPPGQSQMQQLAIDTRSGVRSIEAQGRLVYFTTQSQSGFSFTSLPVGMKMDSASLRSIPPIFDRVFPRMRDSGVVLRVDLASRRFDTAAVLKVPAWKTKFATDNANGLTRIEYTPDLFPFADDYVVMPDGVIAIVRGRDYHIDWIERDGRTTTTPKMPFSWQRLSDSAKDAAADSAVKELQAQYDRQASAGRGGRPGVPAFAPSVVVRPTVNEMPDYVPPFQRGDVHADADGNVWIRTSTIVGRRPVYDIVNRKGEIVDRVQLPPNRVISGFAHEVVFMAVQDTGRVVRLERARIR